MTSVGMQKYYDSDRYQIDDNFYYHTMVNNDKEPISKFYTI